MHWQRLRKASQARPRPSTWLVILSADGLAPELGGVDMAPSTRSCTMLLTQSASAARLALFNGSGRSAACLHHAMHQQQQQQQQHQQQQQQAWVQHSHSKHTQAHEYMRVCLTSAQQSHL